MSAQRFACYLGGGVPPGGSRANPGCRDGAPPRERCAVWLRGGIYFALASPMWGGGLALYDPDLPGAAPACAYLVTAEQFADIAAQEMYRAPAAARDPSRVPAGGRLSLGGGRYETIVHCGHIGGHPVLTFTAHWPRSAVEAAAPAAAYLGVIGAGLRAGHGWSARRCGAYLAARPGAAGVWTARRVAALL
ncbi:histone deacetylase [Streptomonospora sp. PA3]|nr:histone deacetylase [Streptomonospora sp. PA3]MUL40679.1 histone deacetylase [Streptomonospora sp. PA3]